MLDSYTLLLAMNGIDNEAVLEAGKILQYTNSSVHSPRRLWRTLLIAAIIVSLLGCTAYAISLSIHAKRQDQLRQEYQVAENSVSSYEEFETPEEPQPGITLLSAYNNGNVQTVYVNVCPVPPEEVIDPFMQDTETDGRVHYLMYISSIDGGDSKRMATFYIPDREYAPEDLTVFTDDNGNTLEQPTQEAKRRKYLEQAYDAETQTLTLECSFWVKDLPAGATQAELRVFSMDNWAYPDELGGLSIDMKQEIRRDFGTISVDIIPSNTRKLMLEEPVEFSNPEDGHSGYILGFELSSGQITWLLDFDEEVWPYMGSLDEFGEKGSDARRLAFERQLSWIRCEDDVLSDAALITKSGERIPVPGSSGYSVVDGIKQFHGNSWEGTIAISDVQAVYLAGNSYELPPIETTPIGG